MSSPSLNVSWGSVIKTLLGSLPNLQCMNLVSVMGWQMDMANPTSDLGVKLLLSDPPLKKIPRLNSFSLNAVLIDNPGIYAFLELHSQTLRTVKIQHGPYSASYVGPHASSICLPRLKTIIAPDGYFIRLSQEQPSSEAGMSNPSMPVSLTEASITWQDVGAPIDSPIASLSTSYESLTSLTCRRLGTNEDLFELLAGSFTNLKSLTIDGCDLRALDRRSDGAPAPTAMVRESQLKVSSQFSSADCNCI